MGDYRADIVKWLSSRVSSAGAKGVVLGMSGGIDSSVAAALAKEAFPQTALGLLMPCHSPAEDERLALAVAEKFSIATKKVDLGPVCDMLLKGIGRETAGEKGKLACANLKPRLRMAVLYYHASASNYLVLGAGNKSEIELGYFTKHGDNAVDLMPLGGLLKGQVRSLAEELGVPGQVIDRPPSAGLWQGQTDEDEMGVSYAVIDNYLRGDRSGIGEAELGRIEQLINGSEHKRKKPPVFEP